MSGAKSRLLAAGPWQWFLPPIVRAATRQLHYIAQNDLDRAGAESVNRPSTILPPRLDLCPKTTLVCQCSQNLSLVRISPSSSNRPTHFQNRPIASKKLNSPNPPGATSATMSSGVSLNNACSAKVQMELSAHTASILLCSHLAALWFAVLGVSPAGCCYTCHRECLNAVSLDCREKSSPDAIAEAPGPAPNPRISFGSQPERAPHREHHHPKEVGSKGLP